MRCLHLPGRPPGIILPRGLAMPLRYDSFLGGSGGGTPQLPLAFASIRGALTTGTGTQDFTFPGFGTPKAALFVLSGAQSNGTPIDGLDFSLGATDGSSEWVMSSRAEHNAATSNCDRRDAADEVVMLLDDSGAVVLEANFDSWITDGVRINKTVNSLGSSVLLSVALFTGENLSVDAGNVNLAGLDSSVTVTPGFQMGGLIIGSPAYFFNDLATPSTYLGFGLASYNGSTIRQCAASVASTNGQPASSSTGVVRNDACAVRTVASLYVELENITSTSFDLTSRGTDLSMSNVGYLALKYAGGEAWAGVLDSPTAGGDKSWTGVGFKPQFGIMVPTMLSSLATQKADAEAGAIGFSAFDPSGEYCTAWADEDAADPTNNQSLSDDQAINLDGDDGSAAFDATLSSFDADGLTLNFSAADGTARKWPVLFLKAA